MSASHKLIDALNQYSENHFWDEPPNNPTFQEVLDRYEKYSLSLKEESQRKNLDTVFWKKIKEIGTPIIEELPNEKVKVHFLFPQDKYNHNKNKLYVCGDFHGFNSTNDKRQAMHQVPQTDIMHRSDIMQKNSVVIYHFFQAPKEYQNKSRVELGGPGEALPKSFYDIDDFIPTRDADPKLEEFKLKDIYAKNWDYEGNIFCANIANDLSHVQLMINTNWEKLLNYNGQHNGYLKNLSHKNTYLCDKEDNLHKAEGYTLLLLIEKDFNEEVKKSKKPILVKMNNGDFKLWGDKSGQDDWQETEIINFNFPKKWEEMGMVFVSPINQEIFNILNKGHIQAKNVIEPPNFYFDKEDTRSVTVFTPNNMEIDHLIIFHDGNGYMLTGAIERIDALIGKGEVPKNTAVICINTLLGLIEKYKEQSPKEFAEAKNPREIEYGNKIEDYVIFIDNALKQLGYDHVPAKNITLIGGSMSATASLFMSLKYKEKFGNVVAQAPSYSNRIILFDLVKQRKQDKELGKADDLTDNIKLSCGKFDSLEFAQNLNLANTNELAKILGGDKPLPINDKGNYGHTSCCWAQELTETLPKLYSKLESKKESVLSSQSFFSQPPSITIESSNNLKEKLKNRQKNLSVDDIDVRPSSNSVKRKATNKKNVSKDDFDIQYGPKRSGNK